MARTAARPDARAASHVENKSAPPSRKLPPPKESMLLWQNKQVLIDAIKGHSTIILAAGTGTGKTRGGSQIALEALGQSGNIIVTENLRRVTEDSAQTVAGDMGVQVGEEVGVQNRYTHKVSEKTRLLFCPVQSLLIKMETDPLLKEYTMIAMDEVHKESKANELTMISLRDIQAQRKAQGLPELKLMFISATADKEKITKHFPDAVTVDVPGKTFPVDEIYATEPIPVAELPKKAAQQVKMSIDSGDKGNILVFLSGGKEIEEAKKNLDAMGLKDFDVISYSSAQPREEQEKLFAQSSKRKIVLATNAAQEGLTLDINVVVDTGMHKHLELDTATGRQYLTEQPAPKDHLTQRRGRIGRKESPYPGQKDKYIALFTPADRESRPEHEPAEMQRTDITQEMLILLAQGHKDLYNFNYINPPPKSHIDIALQRLGKMGALESGSLTAKGRLMAELSIHPNLASLIASGIDNSAARQTTILASMLEVYPEALDAKNGTPSPFRDPNSDILGFMRLFNEFSAQGSSHGKEWAKKYGLNYQKLKDAKDLYNELVRVIKEKRPDVNMNTEPTPGALDKSIYEAFADSLVKQSFDNSYFIEGVPGIQIARESSLADKKPRFFAAIQIRPLIRDGKISTRLATLNHPLSESLIEKATPQAKAPTPATPPAPPPAPEKKQPVPEPKSEPVKEELPPPPPKPLTLTQRFKTWLSNSIFGKVWRWIIK